MSFIFATKIFFRPQRMTNAIDSIFGAAKSSKPKRVVGALTRRKDNDRSIVGVTVKKDATKRNILSQVVKARPSKGSASDPFLLNRGQNGSSMDFTEEGYRVYTPEELQIGKGGDTADCPFDCQCCF